MTKKLVLQALSGMMVLSCGTEGFETEDNNQLISQEKFNFDANYVESFDLTTEGGELKFNDDTFILGMDDFPECSVPRGRSIKFKSVSKSNNGYRNVTLDGSRSVCGLTQGRIADSDISLSFESRYSLTTKYTTYFKTTTAQSSTLDIQSEKCLIQSSTKLFMNGYANMHGDGVHIKVSLAQKPAKCDFKEGYFYFPHLSEISRSSSDNDQSFPQVMKHILKWEGGCSDHPNDPGGRTFMGITTYRARVNGFYDDVCTMPKSMVLEIYKKDYWNNRAKDHPWPMNLAVMNTEVNSGGGRAQQFLDRMVSQSIEGTVAEKSSWFVDQQTDFYYLIANRNPSLRVFLRGWINRSNHMQDVIWGRLSLFDENIKATAKTNLH